MGDDDAQDASTTRRFGQPLKNAFPAGLDLGQRKPGVDDRPAGSAIGLVGQQPQVDVVERKRQRHAQPVDAWSNL